VFVSAATASLPVFAQATGNCSQPQNTQGANSPNITVPCPNANTCPKGACIINEYINPLVKALSITAGIVVVISIIIGGIQYSAAAGEAGKISAAKTRIMKSLGAFLFFLFLYAFLQFIVPGGVGN